MLDMAKKKPASAKAVGDGKGPNRSPAWAVYARLDPALEKPVEEYINSQEYPPALARVIERALKDLLRKHGYWPPAGADDDA